MMALRPRFTSITVIGVMLLWLTGLWLWFAKYGGANLGVAFVLKLIMAAFILGVAICAFIALKRAKPDTPPPTLLRRLGPVAG